jgi:hypothetical protein
MEKPSNGLHGKQKHGRRYISLAFGSGCVDSIIYIIIVVKEWMKKGSLEKF